MKYFNLICFMLLQIYTANGTLCPYNVPCDGIENKIKFLLSTPKNPGLITIDTTNLAQYNLNEECIIIKIIVHGLSQSPFSSWVPLMTNAYLQKAYCCILVDWSDIASVNNTDFVTFMNVIYPITAAKADCAGKVLGKFIVNIIKTFTISPAFIFHCIGHSLGAHLCGSAGEYVQKNFGTKVDRITGLDPAGPCYDQSCCTNTRRLRMTDANYVDVIHTDCGFLGTEVASGHSDFFVNGGHYQCGCLQSTLQQPSFCNHIRAIYFFIESILSNLFLANTCQDFKTYLCNACINSQPAIMGENIIIGTIGIYYLSTNCTAPFAMNGTRKICCDQINFIICI